MYDEEVKLIQVIIIAPGVASRAGLRALLSEEPQINVLAEAAYLRMTEESLAEADVLVWLPGSTDDLDSQTGMLDQEKNAGLPAVLLIHDNPSIVDTLAHLPVKVWGLLSPEATQAEMIAGIQALNEGLTVIHPAWASMLIKMPDISRNRRNMDSEELTARELEILQLLALGLTNKQIAARLKISAHTVKFHISTIFSKLGTTNRVETVNLGLKKGLIVL